MEVTELEVEHIVLGFTGTNAVRAALIQYAIARLELTEALFATNPARAQAQLGIAIIDLKLLTEQS